MRGRYIILISCVAMMLTLLQGCAVGKGISHFPDRKSEKCDEVTWYKPQSSAVSGWSVPYYIIPFWHEKWDYSEENLRIKMYFKIEGSIDDSLSTSAFYIEDSVSKTKYSPSTIKLTSSNYHEKSRFLMCEAEFDVLSGSLTEFKLIFTQKIYGCSIQPIKYKKSEYDFNGQIL